MIIDTGSFKGNLDRAKPIPKGFYVYSYRTTHKDDPFGVGLCLCLCVIFYKHATLTGSFKRILDSSKTNREDCMFVIFDPFGVVVTGQVASINIRPLPGRLKGFWIRAKP